LREEGEVEEEAGEDGEEEDGEEEIEDGEEEVEIQLHSHSLYLVIVESS
jgi:hypothetical protein